MSVYSVTSGKVALSAAATKSLVLLNPATDAFKVVQIDVSFDSSTAGASIQVDLYRTTTLGTPTGTTGTVVKVSGVGDIAAAGTTALTALTAEPTAVEVIDSFFLTPQGGTFVLQYPLGREPMAAAAGNRIGVRAITPTGVSPNAICTIMFDEV